MNRRVWIIAACGVVVACGLRAQDDPGRTRMGTVEVTVYHATDGDPQAAGDKARPVPAATAERLRREERLRFRHYRLLGQESQPLLRSYESWAQPLRPSDEILVRFEAQSRPSREAAILDLELWLGRKKILKTDARLQGDRPLFMLGPQWRGGRLIIGVALAPKGKTGS